MQWKSPSLPVSGGLTLDKSRNEQRRFVFISCPEKHRIKLPYRGKKNCIVPLCRIIARIAKESCVLFLRFETKALIYRYNVRRIKHRCIFRYKAKLDHFKEINSWSSLLGEETKICTIALQWLAKISSHKSQAKTVANGLPRISTWSFFRDRWGELPGGGGSVWRSRALYGHWANPIHGTSSAPSEELSKAASVLLVG